MKKFAETWQGQPLDGVPASVLAQYIKKSVDIFELLNDTEALVDCAVRVQDWLPAAQPIGFKATR